MTEEATPGQPGIGSRIKRYRLERGLSEEELARTVRLDSEELAKIEAGDVEPAAATIDLVARTLGVPYATLDLRRPLRGLTGSLYGEIGRKGGQPRPDKPHSL